MALHIQIDNSNMPKLLEFVVAEKLINGLGNPIGQHAIDQELIRVKALLHRPEIFITMDLGSDRSECKLIMNQIRSKVVKAGFKVANDRRRT